MYKERVIAWGGGITVCLLIILIGKGCMKMPEKTDKSASFAVTTDSADNQKGFNIIHPTASPDAEKADEITYDIFGRPVKVTEAPTENIEITVDENGNPIEMPVESFTDEYGNIFLPVTEISTDEIQLTTDFSVEATSESTGDEQPTTDGIIIPPEFNGNDHNKYNKDGKVASTLPPDFVLIID